MPMHRGRGHDPDLELPIELGPCSNGEYLPQPLGAVEREAIRRTREEGEAFARRLGIGRREFLRSMGGAALMLGLLAACHDDANRAKGRRSGGTYRIPSSATTEPEAARGAVGGEELVFDVQSHYLAFDLGTPGGLGGFAGGFPQAGCDASDARACFALDEYLALLFSQSDTTMTVLSAIPIAAPDNPLSIEDMEIARAVAQRVCGDGRLLLHGGPQPTAAPLDAVLDGMRTLRAEHPIAAWKVYTHAPGRGWWLDDHEASAPQVGHAFLDRVRAVGPKIVCVHKGFSGGSRYASPEDIGRAAKANPDIRFVVYHSGYEAGEPEGPYTEATADRGVNRLVSALRRAGVGPGENVYAELGSTWWSVMRDPTQAAHVLGKLLVAVGPDRVLWGTDSIWYGSPQAQIQALRAFEIAPELQERHGYPALTAALKEKILGANALELYDVEPVDRRCRATRDDIEAARRSLAVPTRTLGPSTAAELRALLADHALV